jgi:hypothetical protein
MQTNWSRRQSDPATEPAASTVPPQHTSGDLPEEESTRTADTGRSGQAEDVRVAGTPSEHDDIVVPPAPEAQPREAADEKPGDTAAERPTTTDDTGTERPPASPGKEADRIEQLIEPGQVDAFRVSWLEVQSDFVDDPHDAVRRADALAAEVLSALTHALNGQKRALDDRWRADEDEKTDTELLRQALRSYRDFFNRMLGA